MGRLTVLTRMLAAVLVTALGSVSGCAASINQPVSAQPLPPPPPPASGLDLAGLDRGVRAQDSLFGFANGGWLRAATIPPDRVEVGTFADLRVRTEDEQRALIEQARDHPDTEIARKVGDLYASFMDTARLDQLRAGPLDADFAAVDALASPEDVVRYLGTIQRVNVPTPVELRVAPDERNSAVNVLVASQGHLTMPDRTYYTATDPKNRQVREAYRGYVARMLSLAGTPETKAGADAASVLDLETRIARIRWSQVRNREALATYNKFSVADARARTGLDWAGYLAAGGISAGELVISQPSYFTGLSALIRAAPLASWKTYLRWRLLDAAAPYLSSDFVDTRFEFMGKALAGREQNRERWRLGVTCVNTAMGEALGQLYVRRHFSADAKQRMDAMVTRIVAAFRGSIDALDWMSPATKAEAGDKLAKMAVKIGYPDHWKDWSTLEIRPDDLLGNLRRAAALDDQRNVDKIGKPVDHGEWNITPQTVNATYNPSRNEITFPAAILRPPFFDVTADDAVNYGAIGSVIGHEISHGFDDEGRHYDGAGNLRDWWTKADAQRFTAKTRELIRRYNGFSPLPGTHVNGKLTLGENIADLVGLSVALKAYRASPGGAAAPVLDGFTGPQRFFLGYARLWRIKAREESVRRDLRTDSHSPGLFRADGVVNNLDEFYSAWGVKPGDRMFLPPAKRIRLW